jgi:hypothetical protein
MINIYNKDNKKDNNKNNHQFNNKKNINQFKIILLHNIMIILVNN